jgi:hypothetical protein
MPYSTPNTPQGESPTPPTSSPKEMTFQERQEWLMQQALAGLSKIAAEAQAKKAAEAQAGHPAK